MNIVTLLGSPRSQGNSSTIARRIIQAAEADGWTSRTFELNRLTYRGCQGCYACKQGRDDCVVRDDMTEVLAAVREADLVVLATPVYYGDLSSQLKAFMDRTFSYLVPGYATAQQPSRLSPKKLIFVQSQGHPDEASFADIFPRYQYFLKWQNFTEVRLVRACGIGPNTVDAVPEPVLAKAAETWRELTS
ncbi:FMN reductase [Geomonas sp. Red276]